MSIALAYKDTDIYSASYAQALCMIAVVIVAAAAACADCAHDDDDNNRPT